MISLYLPIISHVTHSTAAISSVSNGSKKVFLVNAGLRNMDDSGCVYVP